MMPERRREERVSMILEVRWESLSGKNAARTSDISLGGCYVESMGDVTVGEHVHFQIQLPDGEWRPFHGEVVYHHPNLGFGLRFLGLTEADRDRLTEVLAKARQE